METIGMRVRTWRRRRGMSQRMLADFAGLSQPYVSQLEAGRKAVERRSTLAALAGALHVSAAELAGAGEPGDPAKDRAAAAVPAIRQALVMREAGEHSDPPQPGAPEQAQRLGGEADYATLAEMLPALVGGCDGDELVLSCYETVFTLRYLGYPDLARDAAGLGVAAAREMGQPALIGVAEFYRAHSLPGETAGIAARVAASAAAEVQPQAGDPQVRQAYGMLHLTAGLRNAAAGSPGDAARHLDEASAEADSLGECGTGLARMCFGPANVGAWRMIVGNELADPDGVLRAAEATDWRRLPTARRRACFHIEHGRALATLGRDAEAVHAFLRAEHEAPQYLRLDVTARDTTAAIRKRAHDRAVTPQLRRLLGAVGLV